MVAAQVLAMEILRIGKKFILAKKTLMLGKELNTTATEFLRVSAPQAPHLIISCNLTLFLPDFQRRRMCHEKAGFRLIVLTLKKFGGVVPFPMDFIIDIILAPPRSVVAEVLEASSPLIKLLLLDVEDRGRHCQKGQPNTRVENENGQYCRFLDFCF